MKKIFILEGSPREKGNTALVTDRVLAGLGSRGVRVKRIRAAGLDVAGCRECGTCSATKRGAGCAQDDDMLGVYDELIGCDLLLLASPVFCWGITAQLKTVVDRFFAVLTGDRLLAGKRVALVLTAGGDEFDGADLIVRQFKNFARYAGMEYAGQFVAAGCSDRRGVGRNRLMLEAARAFGRDLRTTLHRRT